MSEYINNLIKQFISATGTKNVDVNSEEFVKEISDWIKRNKAIGENYTSFLKSINVYPNIIGKDTIEIGKGVYDSIAIDTKMKMITPYSKNIEKKKGEIVTAKFGVFSGNPVFFNNDELDNKSDIIDSSIKSRFITHNPYERNCIKNWEQLHNVGENITVGVFGKVYDRDKNLKIRKIDSIRYGFSDYDFKEVYDSDGDNYFYAISSHRRVKKLTRILKNFF